MARSKSKSNRQALKYPMASIYDQSIGRLFRLWQGIMRKKTFGEKTHKAKQIINMWKQRDLSLIRRVQIIKTFITSLFQYSVSTVDIPATYIKEVEWVIYAFVWKDKKERLKRRVLIKNKEEGGLKVLSIKFIVDSVKLKCFFTNIWLW